MHRLRSYLLSRPILFGFLGTSSVFLAAHGPSVLMQHNDRSRTGAILQELTLNHSNVNAKTFGKIASYPVDDQIYAQPLIVPDQVIQGREEVNVVYVATVNNSIYAFDAQDFTRKQPLWHRNYNDAAKGIVPVRNTDVGQNCGEYKDFSGNIGIVGTPVIDDETDTMWFVTRTRQGSKYFQNLHAVDIKTGDERAHSPKLIEFETPGTGAGSVDGKIPFNPRTQNQRPALLLSKGSIYVGWASHCDTGPYHGILAGFDAQSLELQRVFNATPSGEEGGIWMAGQGPSADVDGNLYLITGNGTFDADKGGANYGQAIVKLVPEKDSFKVASWFTPFNFEALNATDSDLGASGALLIPDTNLVLGGGKGGTFYLVDRDKMGGFNADDDSQIVQSFDVAQTRHIHGSPTYWNGTNGQFVYVWAEYKHLRAYRFNGQTFDLPHYAESTMAVPDGMPGGMLSLSANGMKAGTGILWASHPASGDANQAVRPGILRAFDATDITRELWNSNQNMSRDDIGNFAKFSAPTIANGKVYAATFSNQLVVYGLLDESAGTTTPPDPVFDGTIYSFVAAKTNLCMDVPGASGDKGAQIQQWECNGTNAQKFMALKQADGSFALRNQSSRKCFDIPANSMNEGAILQQWDCLKVANQSFRFARRNDGTVEIRGVASDLCLALEDSKGGKGTKVVQKRCSDADEQKWMIKQ
jgi:hypothetical protein